MNSHKPDFLNNSTNINNATSGMPFLNPLAASMLSAAPILPLANAKMNVSQQQQQQQHKSMFFLSQSQEKEKGKRSTLSLFFFYNPDSKRAALFATTKKKETSHIFTLFARLIISQGLFVQILN